MRAKIASGLSARWKPWTRALPAVRKFAAALAKDHPAKADFDALLARLANVVVEPTIAQKSVPPHDSARKHLQEITGKPLTAPAIVKLPTSLAADLPPRAAGVKLAVSRDVESTSLELVVEFTPASKGVRKTGWGTHERIRVGKRDLHNSSVRLQL